MKVELELWHLISLGLTVFAGFFAIAKMLLAQAQKTIDEKFSAFGEHMKQQDNSARRLERDLMELKAELPRDYVRREDYTQAIATIMTKIDALGLRVENYFRELMVKGRSGE